MPSIAALPSIAASCRCGAALLALTIAMTGTIPCAWATVREASADGVDAAGPISPASSSQTPLAPPAHAAVVAAQAAPVDCASMAATAKLVARYRQLGGPLSDIASHGAIGSSKARRELAATIYRERLGEAEAVQRAMQACGHAADAPSQ